MKTTHQEKFPKSTHSHPIHNGNIFTWEGNVGCIEESTLTCGGRNNAAGQVWNDSCDQGFSVRSQRTGELKTFVHHRDIYAGTFPDRETVAWVFKAIDGSGIEIHVLND